MHRTQASTLAFALAAALVTITSAWLAYEGLRVAFEREFQNRLARLASVAASQITASDIEDIRRLGPESGGLLAVQTQLEGLHSVTGFHDLALIDSTRRTLYDVRSGEQGLGEPSVFDTLAADSLTAAFRGRRASTPALAHDGLQTRALFEPVREGGRVIAVLAVEAEPEWESQLNWLRKRLALIALVSVAAIAVLAAILFRGAGRQLALERRLAHSEKLAAMGQLSATLAHEIRNPLAIIRGSARRLGKLEPGAQRLADSVIEEVDRLNGTVSRYLRFARGEPVAVDQPGDAAGALAATLDLLEGELAARHCRLERTGDGAAAVVPLDAESLKQVCLNLILNAIEAVPEGGLLQAGVANDGRRVRMVIADNGPGIPADALARAGEPFFTTKAKGSGLGIFLSRRLVEGAGGQLSFASRPGAGTTVTVEFPLVRG